MAPVDAATTTRFAAARRLALLARRVLRGLPRRVKLARRRAAAVYNRRYRWTYGRSLAHVPSRDEIPALLNARRLFGDAAEIGVKTGKYSDFLLSRWRGRKL